MRAPSDYDSIRTRLRALPRSELVPREGRHAAVAVVVRQTAPGAEILLIRRAEHPLDRWSGHMAFPGGRKEPEDSDLLATALRETREEVGLDLGVRGELWTRLPDIQAVARGRKIGMMITPFVFGVADEALELTPNYEVAEIVWGPVGPLLDGSAATTTVFRGDESHYTLPAFDVQGRIVWGLTYRMLTELLAILRREGRD